MTSIKVITKTNEENDIVIRTKNSGSNVVYGVVLDENLSPLKDAVVKLFDIKSNNGERSLYPITHCFTDENGEFLLGPLSPCKCYFIKVWSSNNIPSSRHIYFEEMENELYCLE